MYQTIKDCIRVFFTYLRFFQAILVILLFVSRSVFDADILSDHFPKQTARNPGCSVMQDGAVIVSCRTSSEDNASIHPSISLQHWAS